MILYEQRYDTLQRIKADIATEMDNLDKYDGWKKVLTHQRMLNEAEAQLKLWTKRLDDAIWENFVAQQERDEFIAVNNINLSYDL